MRRKTPESGAWPWMIFSGKGSKSFLVTSHTFRSVDDFDPSHRFLAAETTQHLWFPQSSIFDP